MAKVELGLYLDNHDNAFFCNACLIYGDKIKMEVIEKAAIAILAIFLIFLLGKALGWW